MNYKQYKQLFEEILANLYPVPPYNEDLYLEYTKLNRSRMRRWDKLLELDENLVSLLRKITTPQHWIIITEPWCGDAAHTVPFLIRMTEQTGYVSYDIQLRDSEPFLIENYLTNGSRSIPKLIVQDASGYDSFNWGPRPKGAQELMDEMKANHADFETIKIALQNWYNKDKGVSLCSELAMLLSIR
ncbi:thioredoxin family protein [Olivibacter ginsenosidimutans]